MNPYRVDDSIFERFEHVNTPIDLRDCQMCLWNACSKEYTTMLVRNKNVKEEVGKHFG